MTLKYSKVYADVLHSHVMRFHPIYFLHWRKNFVLGPPLTISNKLHTFCLFRLRLDWASLFGVFLFLRFFFFVLARVCETCGYCSYTVQWTVTTKFDFSHFFQPISALRALFMDSQISFFSNFFIKNGSHDTIHIFKNYFATVFFSFQFQFSVVSKRTLSLIL